MMQVSSRAQILIIHEEPVLLDANCATAAGAVMVYGRRAMIPSDYPMLALVPGPTRS
jgi:hypothetical protein